ncbi:MAG: alpha/beta hydrolase [Anaerolineae bacterium]|nr:alpha/beta hydrolase [Anaerolineae bacterium]CAG0994924.1 Arylesterase [Anaerolineae bacterium]
MAQNSLWARFNPTNLSRMYQTELTQAEVRQLEGSRLLHTTVGPIEYALREGDEDRVVIISHPSMGGYDQALAIGRRFPGWRVIAPSRGAYLRTPRETGETPAHMADAFAALLDALNIDQAVLGGYSAGGMAALEFALRHPRRCRGLILAGAISQPLNDFVMNILAPIALANRSDFVNWVITKAAYRALPLLESDPETLEILRAFQQTNPLRLRYPGYVLDVSQIKTFRPELAAVQCPTLILHGDRDPLIPVSHAHRAMRLIPGAQSLIIQGGNHDAPIRYPQQVLPVMRRFLDSL